MVDLDQGLDQPAVTPRLVEDGWDTREEVGGGIVALHYPDGAIRVEHYCTRQRDGLSIICAPALQLGGGGHTATGGLGHLTVTPSILCGDCGLHGHITDGTWKAC